MRPWRCESGQAVVEYVGVVLLLALVLLALSTLDLGPQVADALAGSVCEVAGLASCRSHDAELSAVEDLPVDPELTPVTRAALLGDPRGAQVVLASLSRAERAWIERDEPAAAAGVARAEAWAQRRRLVDRFAGGDLGDFLRYRDSDGRDPRLDYSTDYCSAPILGSRGLGYDFTDACVRHDFGYRNYKELGLFPPTRASIDGVFLRDMRAHCATRGLLMRPRCHQRALQYWAGVRAFGGRG